MTTDLTAAARQAILKMDELPDGCMEALIALVRTTLAGGGRPDTALDAAWTGFSRTAKLDDAGDLDKLNALRGALGAAALDGAELLAALHHVDTQFRSRGVYRSGSAAWAYNKRDDKTRVEVAMGIDVAEGTGVVRGIRFGSLTCKSGSCVLGDACECRHVGVGPDRVVLSGVVCPDDAADADGFVATTKYVTDACNKVVARGNTGLAVVDACYVAVKSKDGVALATYGAKTRGLATLEIQTGLEQPSPGRVSVVDAGAVLDVGSGVKAIHTDPDTATTFPFLFRLTGSAVYSVVLTGSTMRITRVAAGLEPGKGLYIDTNGRIALLDEPVSTLTLQPPAPSATSTATPGRVANVISSQTRPDDSGTTSRAPLAFSASAAFFDCNLHITSDARLKDDIRTLPGALGMCRRLRGVEFRWRDAERCGGYQMGVIAQEVQAVYPSLVDGMDGGFLAVDYAKLVGLLIEAVKELDAEVTRLRGD